MAELYWIALHCTGAPNEVASEFINVQGKLSTIN